MISVKSLEEQSTAKVEPLPLRQAPEPSNLIFMAHKARNMGAEVSITGQWVWATFSSKPPQAILEELRSSKWIWCRTKGKWAYREVKAHSHKAMPWDYITSKYGEEKLEDN